MLEGHDLGPAVRRFWLADEEYEYWRTVSAQYKDPVLVWLMKERFSDFSEFTAWLDEKSIPSEFANWVYLG